ncbi:MAG: glycerol-3-phosphate 1-O-acyltransferase PlsY [Candidatus Saganbacteria bacterium]|nr:glycerol-3-phosphate 1-O-acyltransferase PlsY [Candidatus Saganbacteria bacterium]
MKPILFILLAYLLGSIPFSHIFPRLKGRDVAAGGTKNIGATNALVVAGPLMGALALVGDIGKGFLAVYLAQRFVGNPWIIAFSGLAAVIGHDFSVFLKFKGGKGVATTGGALIALDPIFALITILLWALLILVTRYFILSTLIILAGIPLMLLVLGQPLAYATFGCFAFLLSLYTHRKDIKRLLAGKELRLSESFKHYLNK